MPKFKDSEKLNKILNAALKLFSEKGFTNTKMEEIATAAGIATGTIYIYVKNKEEILEKLFDRFYRYYASRLEEELKSISDEKQKLQLLIKKDLDVLFESEERIRLFLIELRQSPFTLQHIKKMIIQHYKKFFELILGNNIKQIDLLSVVVSGIVENFAYYVWLSPEKNVIELVSMHSKLIPLILSIIEETKKF